MNSVKYLIENSGLLADEDILKIKGLGRETPDLKIDYKGSSRNRSYKRQFNSSVYVTTNWICGCSSRNALYCFPCLLYGGEHAWTVNGVTDLCHLSEKIKRHENSRQHLSNEVDLAFLGNATIQKQLDSEYWRNIESHNTQVMKNERLLSELINCINSCASFELAVSESGIRSRVNLAADLACVLQPLLEKEPALKDAAQDIQNMLLDSMLAVCRNEIIIDVKHANYIAVMAEETSGAHTKSQLALVVRYIKSCKPVERFWGFLCPAEEDVSTYTESVLTVLDPLLLHNSFKLVAQAYDGSLLMSRKNDSVHEKILKKYETAYFIDGYAHDLTAVVVQIASQDQQVRAFFANVADIIAFFTNTKEQHFEVIKLVINLTRDFKNNAVNVIHKNRDALVEYLQRLQSELASDGEEPGKASAIEHVLQDNIFLFWLNIFDNIMPHVNELNGELKSPELDAIHAENAVETFENNIVNVRGNMETIIQEGVENGFETKRKCVGIPQRLQESAVEICNNLIATTSARFANSDHLAASALLNPKKFKLYEASFPLDPFARTINAYPTLEADRLRTELITVYARLEFRKVQGAVSFLSMLRANEMQSLLREVHKLLEIIITVPMRTCETERCFRNLECVRNFSKNTVDDERDTALAMLAIERSLVHNDPKFNLKVIEKFMEQEQCLVDLIYKK